MRSFEQAALGVKNASGFDSRASRKHQDLRVAHDRALRRRRRVVQLIFRTTTRGNPWAKKIDVQS
jgi:hypothetical protein